VQIYADDQQQKDMKKCNRHCVKILKPFVERTDTDSRFRAMDVGGGDARMSLNMFTDFYNKVDLFDPCPVAIERAKKALEGNNAFGYAEKATMQNFEWKFLYNGIFMVWVAGYLSDSSLAAFLKRTKVQLDSSGGPTRRSKKPKSL